MKDAIALQQELHSARSLIQVGDIYYHYKHPQRHYQIISLAFLESSEEMSVVYLSLYEPYLTWIRPLTNFCEKVVVKGKMQNRFSKVSSG